MGLSHLFLPEKRPRQWLHIGESLIQVVRPGAPQGANRTIAFSAIGEPQLPLAALKPELLALDTGVVLSPTFFIFNLFEFDAIPWQPRLRREVIEWRLQKIFPEPLENYLHHYRAIAPRRFLSILLRQSWSDTIEDAFASLQVPLIRLTSSTIQLANSIFQGAAAPDCFIELEKSQIVMAFQRRRRLVYMRKFNYEHAHDVAAECLKTIQYVTSTLALTPTTFALTGFPDAGPGAAQITAELAQHGLHPSPLADAAALYFHQP
jgi:hypothetical protein